MNSQPESSSNISILIAEDNTISRELMASILRTHGYTIVHAADGGAAIDIVRQQPIDMAFVDINMSPRGGFDFIRYMAGNGIDVPVVIVTADDSGDLLVQARQLNVANILIKPVEPARLLNIAQRILRAKGLLTQPLAVEVKSQNFSTEDLMRRALELAEENVLSGKGGPYGAVVADSQGKIVGTGVNGIASRADPIAHAEVMAIRQACDRLGTDDLSACVLYVSSEPTSVGQALIKSVGIKQVYFGLSHADVHRVREASRRVQREKILPDTHYEQLCGAEALAMFYAASEQNDKAIAS